MGFRPRNKPETGAVKELIANEADVLRERLDTDLKTRLGFELKIDSPISRESLQRLEKEIGWSFPKEYVELVTNTGLLHEERSWNGVASQVDGRMLKPEVIREIHASFKNFVKESCTEYEDDEEGAALEQAARDALVPFQFIGDGTSWDVYCFVRGDVRDGQVRVISAYHDDEVIALWSEQKLAKRRYGMLSHLRSWLSDRGEAVGLPSEP